MSDNNKLKIIVDALSEKKGEDIEILQVRNLTTIADYFVLCTGTSTPQIRALAENVEKKVKETYEVDPHHTEGYRTASWILLDYGLVLVHVFHRDTRDFYGLEKLWKDATRLDAQAL